MTRRLAAPSRWTSYGLIAGALAGLGAVLFHMALQTVPEHLLQGPSGYYPPEPGPEAGSLPPVGAGPVPELEENGR